MVTASVPKHQSQCNTRQYTDRKPCPIMKSAIIVVFAAVLAVAVAAPIDDSKTVILKYENDNIGIDGYKFA